jgi:hypothetical protein
VAIVSVAATSGLSLLGKMEYLGDSATLSQLLPLQVTRPVSPIGISTPPSSPITKFYDPLESSFPIPWSLIQKAQLQANQTGQIITSQYQSSALASPDGKIGAYSDISISIGPKADQSIVSSQIVLTDNLGRVLQKIPASVHYEEADSGASLGNLKGVMAILIPVTWSEDSQQLLARQFEAVIGSDVASDHAFIWKRDVQKAKTVTPLPLDYDTAVLLGWNPANSNQLLFRTSRLGEASTQTIAVDERGKTIVMTSAHP